MKANDFDKLAFVYDRLAKLVFGKSIIESQEVFLNEIPDQSRVLILGGGSGQIIEKLLTVKPTVEIYFIEASKKMIALAKSKLRDDNRIQFIHGTENDIPNIRFNTAITNFYLDLFDEESLKEVLQKIKTSLTPSATWIATDFVDNGWWHRMMLKIMYSFFKMTVRIEARKLPNWSAVIGLAGGQKMESKFFYGGFIETSVFQF